MVKYIQSFGSWVSFHLQVRKTDLPGASLRKNPVTENISSNAPALSFSHLKTESEPAFETVF
jgi:hypothetical protein